MKNVTFTLTELEAKCLLHAAGNTTDFPDALEAVFPVPKDEAACLSAIVKIQKALARPSDEDVARMFRCTLKQVQTLRAKNHQQLTRMYQQACSTGKPVSGYTAEQLRQILNGL